MAVTLTLTGKTPGQQQFGLDTFTEHYKCDATADVVLTDAGVPQMGSAHPDYDFMFVTSRYCDETGEKASALDLIYTGCLKDDGEGGPSLPAQQQTDSDAVQSASSSRGSGGQVLSSPMTVQFYAPTTELSFVTYGAKGTRGTVTDPTDDIRIISITIGDVSFLPGSVIDTLISQFFSESISGTITSPEIVATKYWQNRDVKTKQLLPFLFTTVGNDFLVLAAPGSGYTIGDTLTISGGGGTAAVTVDQVGISDSITGFTVTSNTYTANSPPVAASGGSGSGAFFQNVHIA